MVHHQLQVGLHVQMSRIKESSLRSVGVLSRQMIIRSISQSVDCHHILFALWFQCQQLHAVCIRHLVLLRGVVMLHVYVSQLQTAHIQHQVILAFRLIRSLWLLLVALKGIYYKLEVGRAVSRLKHFRTQSVYIRALHLHLMRHQVLQVYAHRYPVGLQHRPLLSVFHIQSKEVHIHGAEVHAHAVYLHFGLKLFLQQIGGKLKQPLLTRTRVYIEERSQQQHQNQRHQSA